MGSQMCASPYTQAHPYSAHAQTNRNWVTLTASAEATQATKQKKKTKDPKFTPFKLAEELSRACNAYTRILSGMLLTPAKKMFRSVQGNASNANNNNSFDKLARNNPTKRALCNMIKSRGKKSAENFRRTQTHAIPTPMIDILIRRNLKSFKIAFLPLPNWKTDFLVHSVRTCCYIHNIERVSALSRSLVFAHAHEKCSYPSNGFV